jgi:hypothetical protein
MTDYEQTVQMLDRAKQPHFHYCEVGSEPLRRVMVLDDKRDGIRIVPLLIFDAKTGDFVRADTRVIDP